MGNRKSKPRPYLIGLTGNIATGKSTVAALLRQFGAQVIDSDALVHELLEPGTRVFREVVAAFGRGILSEGRIDRKKLGALVFADPGQMKRLEAIVHPAVKARRAEIVAVSDNPVIVFEAIRLIESGASEACDTLWVTTCSRDQQVERLCSERGLSREEAELRIDAQPPQEEKLRHADVVIENEGDLEGLRSRALELWQKIEASRLALPHQS